MAHTACRGRRSALLIWFASGRFDTLRLPKAITYVFCQAITIDLPKR